MAARRDRAVSGGFLAFLFLPLIVVAVFAFNDAPYPAPPWHGFTWTGFWATRDRARRLVQGSDLLGSIWTSFVVAAWVTVLSVLVGTLQCLSDRAPDFAGKQTLSILMLAPLVIPESFSASRFSRSRAGVAEFADDVFGFDWDFLRPGLPLVVLGQFSYVATIATLTISARLRRFDRTLEEAALNLGAASSRRCCAPSSCRICAPP